MSSQVPPLVVRISCLLASVMLVSCTPLPKLPDDGYVDVPGGRIAFRVIGEGTGTPVLVIHGGPGGRSCIYPQTLGELPAERPIIVYDQLGTGYSDRMTDFEEQAKLSRFVAEVDSIRNELGLSDLHILGHSWGAAIALEYLLTEDWSGVQSVVFVGPFFGAERWMKDAELLVSQLPDGVQEAIADAKALGDYSSEEFQAANNSFKAEYMVRTPWESVDLPDCRRSPPRSTDLYEYMWGPSEFIITGTLREFDRIDRLPELRLPVLFLVAEYDEVLPETVVEYQRLVPGSVVEVIPEAGHIVNVDQPEIFNKVVNEFLVEVESR